MATATRAKVPVYTPGVCIYTHHDGVALFKCQAKVEEGWVCPDHQQKLGRRRLGTFSQAEIEGTSLALDLQNEILAKGGTRIGSHFHLMKATIFKADGSEAFPDRWNPSLNKFLMPAPWEVERTVDWE